MLSEYPFSPADLEKIKQIPRRFILYFLIYALSIPLAFIFGLMGVLKIWDSYWQTTVTFLVLFTGTFLVVLGKKYLDYRSDLKDQIKYCGVITVTGKVPGKNSTIILTGQAGLEEIDVDEKSVFEEVQVGDTLEFEISKHSKFLFSLQRLGTELITHIA